jgi:predicted nuclease with TOPRIM domain
MTICISPHTEHAEDIAQLERQSRENSTNDDDIETKTVQELIEENRRQRDEHKKERKIRDALNKHLQDMKDEIAKLKSMIPEHREEIDELRKNSEELVQKKLVADKENILLQYNLRKVQSVGDKLRSQIAAQKKENKQLAQQKMCSTSIIIAENVTEPELL